MWFPFVQTNGFHPTRRYQSRYTNHSKTFYIDTSTGLLLYSRYIILLIQVHIIQYIRADTRIDIGNVVYMYFTVGSGRKRLKSNIISTKVFFLPSLYPLITDVNLFRSERLPFVVRVQFFPTWCVIFYVPICLQKIISSDNGFL